MAAQPHGSALRRPRTDRNNRLDKQLDSLRRRINSLTTDTDYMSKDGVLFAE